ncbi:MAG: histidine phosphatase family protein [Sulfolobales archaeon]|nr:histidine phosphatase family protein [Sulfolobales archaeon]MCX8209149.1 histidine phosphatase family protein [Sulfolobales archaeon]MDW8010683.1 histidine phosphatase family protein [Sulfolobales archaeon]
MFMRHAKALEARPGERDEERRLSSEGIEEVVTVSRFIPRVKIVYSSPLRRAVETAEIVSQAHRVEFRVLEELAPGHYLKDVEPYFTDRALLVGHSPYIEDCVAELTGYRPTIPTAGVVGMRRTGGIWLIEFFITPQYAREIAERISRYYST